MSQDFKKIQIFFNWLAGFCLILMLNENSLPARDFLNPQTTANSYFRLAATFLGTHRQERVGYWLQGTGDVNGDGYSDFLVGNYHNKVQGYDAGAVYLILGRPTDQWKLDVSLEDADARFLGLSTYNALGYHVSGGGDINGDGLVDFVIGAPAGSRMSTYDPGSAYLIWGRKTANWGKNFIPANSSDASYVGEKGGHQAGKAVAIVGDLNKDGFADVVVGAPFYDGIVKSGGKVYFIFGRKGGWINRMNLMQSEASFYSVQEGDEAGYMVAGPGDVDGDGLADVLIGAPNRGNVYLIFGRKPANWGHDNSLANADVRFIGEGTGYSTGWILAAAGDVNADGYADFLITAPSNSIAASEAGKAYLILGKPKPWPRSVRLDTVKAFYIGEKANDNFGWSAGTIRDLNRDGYDDFMIGAWHNDQSGLDAGKAYLIWGKKSEIWSGTKAETIPDFITGETDSSFMGFHVASAGDVNADKIPDFIVSAAYNSQSERWAGKIYLYLGQTQSFAVSGQVAYFDNQKPIPEVKIACQGAVQDCVLTDPAGNYRFILSGSSDFQLTPTLARGTRQNDMAILSYDAALIARHVLNLQNLGSFQLKAADVDQDEKITLYDASLIARHVVQLPPLANSHVGEWQFDPPGREYQNFSDSLKNQNFTAFILGNVHGGWSGELSFEKQGELLANLMGSLPDTITSDTVLNWPIELPFEREILSLDLSLEFQPEVLEYSGIKLSESNDALSIIENCSSGKVNLSIFSPIPFSLPSEMFHISVRIKKTTYTQTCIKLNRIIINSEFIGTQTKVIQLEDCSLLPAEFSLAPNFPNPFNAATRFSYRVPAPDRITIEIFNLRGQKIRTLLSQPHQTGVFFVDWDGRDDAARETASGIYFCKANFGNQTKFRRLLKLN